MLSSNKTDDGDLLIPVQQYFRPAVFLDRDGTINIDSGYVHRIEDWQWIPGAIESIAAFNKAGYLVILVTNQAGIARNYYSEKDLINLHSWVNLELKRHVAKIDGFYHCPHHPEFSTACLCRKPMPGMIYQASRDFNIDLNCSWLVGDKVSDIQAGNAAGVKSILVLTGYGEKERVLLGEDAICVPDIEAASSYILLRA